LQNKKREKESKMKLLAKKKMKTYTSFVEWKRDQSVRNQRLISQLSRIVKKTAPDFTATVKWGQGCWILNNAPKVYIHAVADHLHFGFFTGSQLRDPESLLVGKGKHIRHHCCPVRGIA
jgi:hypothetical protein